MPLHGVKDRIVAIVNVTLRKTSADVRKAVGASPVGHAPAKRQVSASHLRRQKIGPGSAVPQ